MMRRLRAFCIPHFGESRANSKGQSDRPLSQAIAILKVANYLYYLSASAQFSSLKFSLDSDSTKKVFSQIHLNPPPHPAH
jgi:hypothetical protein